MPTLDKLPPDKRAIIELVLRRGKTYDDLATLLQMPPARVRDYARDALWALAPRTAGRVDPDWRGQLADYVLGQQSGPEATATRSHLKRSEPARAWALSVLDSLGSLYEDGREPPIPEAEEGRIRAPRLRRARPARVTPTAAPPAPAPAPAAAEPPAAPAEEAPPRPARPLSPEARAIVLRRRVGIGALAVVATVGLVFAATRIFDGDDDEGAPAEAPSGSPQAAILGQLELKPVNAAEGEGAALITQQADGLQLVVQARLEPNARDEAYEVWLYNDVDDARSLGAQVTDREGSYLGAGPLPADFERYEFIDVSREKTDQNAEHSGESILRAKIAGGPASGDAGGAAPPGTDTPSPSGSPSLPGGPGSGADAP